MNESVITYAPSPERGARSTAEPATRALDDEELARIVRIVRATLEAGSAKKEEKPAASLWQRAAPFCLEHWALTAFAASVLMLIGAAVGYGASPFYWFKQIAVADKELDQKQKKFNYDEEVADRQVKLGNQLPDVWKLKDSAKAFEDALKENPYNNAAAFGLYKTKMFEKAASGDYDPEVSEQRLKLVLDLNENDPHALAALGDYYYQQRAWDQARKHYTLAIKQREAAIEQRKALKQFAHALYGLGTVELENHKYAAAVGPLSEAAELSRFNWEYLDNLAFAQSQSGQIEAALKTYDSLNSLYPNLILPYLERARLHLQQGDIENVHSIEHIANLIEKEDIAKGADNNAAWFFPTGEESVYLRDLEAKRAYVHGSRAAISYIVGEERNARPGGAIGPETLQGKHNERNTADPLRPRKAGAKAGRSGCAGATICRLVAAAARRETVGLPVTRRMTSRSRRSSWRSGFSPQSRSP